MPRIWPLDQALLVCQQYLLSSSSTSFYQAPSFSWALRTYLGLSGPLTWPLRSYSVRQAFYCIFFITSFLINSFISVPQGKCIGWVADIARRCYAQTQYPMAVENFKCFGLNHHLFSCGPKKENVTNERADKKICDWEHLQVQPEQFKKPEDKKRQAPEWKATKYPV